MFKTKKTKYTIQQMIDYQWRGFKRMNKKGVEFKQ